MSDYYHVLGLQRNATEDQIRKAYHTLAIKFHPFKNVMKAYAGEQMARINEAYSILSDPERRAAYDQSAPAPVARNLVLHKLSQNFNSVCHRLSGSVEPYYNDNGSPYGKIIVGLLIGGGVVAVYMTYRRGEVIISPPPYQPVLDLVTPTASVKPEISDISPTSLWSLAALLAALRSKNVLRLAKSTASSQARVIAKTIAEGSQSALSSAAKTISSGTQAAPSASSVNPAVIVVATGKATAGGFRVWTWAAGLLRKALSLRFPLSPVLAFRMRRLGNYATRTSVQAIQQSKSRLSSVATKIGAETVRCASKARNMRPADWYSAWNSAVNRVTKVVKRNKVPFKPLSSQNIIYICSTHAPQGF